MAETPAPIQPDINDQKTAGLSKRMNIFFWIIWSVFLLIDLLMLSDLFSWTRCIILLGIQVLIVYLRNKLFGKTLVALFVWIITLVIVLLTIAYTDGNEEMAFKQYKDYRQENKAALIVLDAFAEAADKGDVKTTVSLFAEGSQRTYTDLFAKDPEKLKLIAKAIKDAEMSQLSQPEPEAAGYPRYAEYEVAYDGLTFHIRMVKINGQWMIDKL